MRKLTMMLLSLFVIYFIIQISFNFFGTGHTIVYNLKEGENFFTVEEKFTNNTSDEVNSYHFKIKFKDDEIVFQTYEYFSNNERIINKIEYFEDDNYKCILPVFSSGRTVSDLLCLHNNSLTYYHNLIGKSKKLDEFANKLTMYDIGSKFIDKIETKNKTELETITFYEDNILENHFISFTDYKGLFTLNKINFKKIHHIDLFKNDVYKRDIEVFLEDYYIVPNYNQKHDYNDIFILNTVDNKLIKISSHQKISFDSYIQGLIDNKIYLVDVKNNIQYKLDLKKEIILEVGNVDTGALIYENGKLNRVKFDEVASKPYLFYKKELSSSDKTYYKIDKMHYENTGYTYFYKKNKNSVEVYRAPNASTDLKTHLFTVDNIQNVKYVDDYIYFEDGHYIKYYSDKTGLKTLLKNEEYSFNKNLKFWAYIKK